MRRLVAMLLTVAMLALSAPAPVVRAAEEPQVSDIGVQVDGNRLEVVVINVAGRTLVPLRAVGDVLGAVIAWDQATRTATLTLDDRTVSLQIGSSMATVILGGQSQTVALDAPALLFQDRTYVPARFVAEGLGYQVAFNAANRIVTISDPAPGSGDGPNTVGSASPAAARWDRYDLTGDGRVDSADAQALWAPSTAGSTTRDLNGDGKQDAQDMWDMALRLTEWDRTADAAVDASDFAPPTPIALPEPDAEAADALARAMLAEVESKIPTDLESKLAAEWAPLGAVTDVQRGALWEEAGITSLLIGNLEVAQWAFARSYLASPVRDSALANLGFIRAETGRHEEAMLLYARAREMNPQACTTNSNIAWVFARHNQFDEAIDYHRQAVTHCGDFAQYHLNLGAVLLRAGRTAEAQLEFKKAADLNPGDDQAFIIAAASNPATPKPMTGYAQEYQRRQEEWVRIAVEQGEMEPQDAATAIVPWENLRVSSKWEEIRQSIGDQVWGELQKQLDELGKQTSERLHQKAKQALPQGQSACADYKRWAEHAFDTYAEMLDIEQAAQMEANQLAAGANRKIAAMELSLDRLLLEMALAEAQEDMLRYSSDTSAREAFERSIHDNYTRPMAEAQQRTQQKWGIGNLVIPDADELGEAVLLGGLMLPFSVLAEGYTDLDDCGAPPPEDDGWKFTEPEQSYAIGIAIVQLEYKPDSGEIKLQVGQGALVAGTWSPKNGFGVQAGLGFDVKWGPLRAGGATWVKRGSDGSVTLEVEGGGGLGVGRSKGNDPMSEQSIGTAWQGSATKTLRAATNEPIGAIR